MEEIILFLSKVILSSIMVIGITVVAEKGNPRLAGVLMGFPLGAGLALLFLGIEQGVGFAAHSALWSIPGVLAMLSFCLGYSLAGQLTSGNSIKTILLCTFVGLIFYFLVAFSLQRLLPDTTLARFLVLLIFTPIFAYLLKCRNKVEVDRSTKTEGNVIILINRIAFASLIIIMITGIAKSIGPTWSGLFATFPTAILPSTLILHRQHGSELIPTIFQETTFGMFAIVVFAIGVHFFFPSLGVIIGAFLAYGVAFVYLFLYELHIRPVIRKIVGIK